MKPKKLALRPLTLLLALILVSNISCTRFNRSKKFIRREGDKISNCMNNWVYSDLEKSQKIRVEIIDKQSSFDLFYFPNLIIGVTEKDDTIAVIDKDYEGKVLEGETITIQPAKWSEEDKELITPCTTVNKSTKKNDLYCAVTNAYYGSISK